MVTKPAARQKRSCSESSRPSLANHPAKQPRLVPQAYYSPLDSITEVNDETESREDSSTPGLDFIAAEPHNHAVFKNDVQFITAFVSSHGGSENEASEAEEFIDIEVSSTSSMDDDEDNHLEISDGVANVYNLKPVAKRSKLHIEGRSRSTKTRHVKRSRMVEATTTYDPMTCCKPLSMKC